MKEKFCGYCRNFKVDEGFKRMLHRASGTPRYMCTPCQAVRKLSAEDREKSLVAERGARLVSKEAEERDRIKREQAARDTAHERCSAENASMTTAVILSKLFSGKL